MADRLGGAGEQSTGRINLALREHYICAEAITGQLSARTSCSFGSKKHWKESLNLHIDLIGKNGGRSSVDWSNIVLGSIQSLRRG